MGLFEYVSVRAAVVGRGTDHQLSGAVKNDECSHSLLFLPERAV